MRNLKKVLSLVLCLAMMLSIMVMGAGAAFTDQDKIVNEEAVDMCAALNIINGYDDDSYRPEGNITRAETTKLIAMMLNGGKEGNLPEAGYSSFSDVLTSPNSKWASPYIEYCVADGIVCGWDGMFAPDNNVTATEAAKMLLVSLGYKSDKEGFENAGWDVRVNVKASQVGLYDGLKGMDVSAPLTRDNAAQMVWNALNAKTVKYLSSGDVYEGETLLAKAYGATVDTGVMAQVYYNQDTKEYTYSIVDVNVDRNSWWNVIGGGSFLKDADTYVTTADYSDLFAMNVTVLHKGDQALLIRVNEGGTVVEGNLSDIREFDGTSIDATTSVKVNGTTYRLDNVVGDAANVTVAFNGFDDYSSRPGDAPYRNPALKEQYAFRAIDLDGGKDIDLFVVYPYAVMKTDLVKTNTFRANELKGSDAYLTATTQGAQDSTLIGLLHRDAGKLVQRHEVVVNGTVATDGYVKVVPATFTATGMDTYTVLNTQSATVTKAANMDNMITLGDKEYNGNLLTPLDAFKQISVGKDYSFVEVNGYLFIVDGTGIVPATTEYTVVTKVAPNATTVNNTYETTMLLPDGTSITENAIETNNVKPGVGNMYTYSVNAAGTYVLTPVKDGKAADTTSVFDYQQAYAEYANLDGNPADGVDGRFKVTNGTPYFANEWATTKYWAIEDDAQIFAFIDRTPDNGDMRGDEYVVLKGSDLKGLEDTDVTWAFTGANITSQGVPTVRMGYIKLTADPRDTSEYAYVNGVSYRDGGYAVDVNVVTADGPEVLHSAKYYSQKDPVLVDLYTNLNTKGTIVKVIYDKDGFLVGYDVIDTIESVVAQYNGKEISFTGTNFYNVTDTVMIDVAGENNLTVGDNVKYLLDGSDLALIVYNY